MLIVLLLVIKLSAVIVSNMPSSTPPRGDSASTDHQMIYHTPASKKRMVSAELTAFTDGGTKMLMNDNNNSNITGTIRGEYPCIWQNYNGTLTAGNKAVVFTGSFFLFEKTLILQWDEIRKVSHDENDGIEIVLSDGATTHSFHRLHGADTVWLLLMTLHNEALLGLHKEEDGTTTTPKQQRRSLKRRKSDPASATSTESKDDSYEEQLPKDRAVIRSVTSLSDHIDIATIIDGSQNEDNIDELKLKAVKTRYDGLAGLLYATSHAIYFTGQGYFWQHTIVTIPWCAVKQVLVVASKDKPRDDESNNNKSSDNRVLTIRTKDAIIRTDGSGSNADRSFEFGEIESKNSEYNSIDKIHALFITLHNENLVNKNTSTTRMLRERQVQTAVQQRRSTIRRMNSDPIAQQRLNFDDYKDQDGSKQPSTDDFPVDASATATTSATATSTDSSGGDAWTAAINSTDASKYKERVIEDHVLSDCSLDKFFELFIADDAKYSLKRYLKSIGEFNLNSTEWKACGENDDNDTNDTNMTRRVVKYMHPVNAPLAPPEAGARKEQTLQRFGDQGILVETETYVDDVPLTDCFYVADRIRVEPMDKTDKNKAAVSVTMEFGMIFVKSTMFKSVITKKTTSEFEIYFESMAQFMSDAVSGVLPLEEEEKEGVAPKDEMEPSKETRTKVQLRKPQQAPILSAFLSGISLERVFIFFVVVLQLWILMELRGIKRVLLEASHRTAANGGQKCAAN